MSPSNTPAPLYLCLRVPEFAAQTLVRLRPSLRNAAVAVLDGDPPLEKVCAATLPARRLGLRHGMTRTETESFPGLTVLRRSPPEEESAATILMEMAARFTPRLQPLPRTSALTLALDMAGSERIFGSPQTIGHKLLRATRDLGFSTRVAASQNLNTAACIVRAPGDTLTVVPPGQERARLHDLPLATLGLTDDLADTFNAWGLRSVGELAALSPVDIVARLGEEGHRLLRLARGEEPHLFVPAEPAFSLQEQLAFDSPVDNLDSLLFVLGPLLDQLILRARNRALLLASVTVCLHLERSEDAADRDRTRDPAATPGVASTAPPSQHPGAPSITVPSRLVRSEAAATQDSMASPTHTRTLKPALPVDDRNLLLKLLQLDLQAHPAPAAITGIILSAEPGPRPGVQSGLFSPQLPEPLRLEVTLARITALVGEGRVGRAVLTDTNKPEAFRMERLSFEDNTTRKHSPKTTAPEPTRTGIALRHLRPPRPVQIWQSNGQLQAFAFKEHSYGSTLYTVQRAFGPWRRSGHWWSGSAWSHEEWDIDATASNGNRLLCLLTHDLLQSQWHIAALYD